MGTRQEVLKQCCEAQYDDGERAFNTNMPRVCLTKREHLKYPNDFDALSSAWFSGWDEAKKAEAHPTQPPPAGAD